MGVASPGVIDDFSGPDGDLFEMYEPADAQEAAEVTRLVVERVLKSGALRIRRVQHFAQPRAKIAACGTTLRPEAAQPRSVFSAVAASVCDGLRKRWVASGMKPTANPGQRLSNVSASNAF